jgi:hypothetical protein
MTPPRTSPSASIVALIFIVALAGLLFAPRLAVAVCPHPVTVQGRAVSCDGSLAADPTPAPPPVATRRP